MKTRECPSCAMPVEYKNSTCPICGYEFPKTNNTWKWLAIILVLLFLFQVFRGLL